MINKNKILVQHGNDVNLVPGRDTTNKYRFPNVLSIVSSNFCVCVSIGNQICNVLRFPVELKYICVIKTSEAEGYKLAY